MASGALGARHSAVRHGLAQRVMRAGTHQCARGMVARQAHLASTDMGVGKPAVIERDVLTAPTRLDPGGGVDDGPQ